MFDDPKKRLQELDFALKEAEQEEDLDWLQEAKALLDDYEEQEVPIRNQANNYGRGREAWDQEPPEEMTESDALYVEKPKRKGAGGLVFLALLELIAMGLIVLWWIRWMV